MMKRGLCLILALGLMIACLPAQVFAAAQTMFILPGGQSELVRRTVFDGRRLFAGARRRHYAAGDCG